MLTPKQRQYLKAQAHHLKPVAHVGKAGVTEGLVQELDIMLDNLELIKLKLNQNTLEDADNLGNILTERLPGLHHVWTIGRTLLLYRASRTHPTRYPFPESALKPPSDSK